MKQLMENWRKYVAETEAEVEEAKNKDGKEQGSDGKACWDGYKHAGTGEDGKDKCVPMEEAEKTDGRSPSDVELVNKVAKLMTSDPEFRILSPFVDKFIRYSKSGGAVESSLEAAVPEWVAGKHIFAIMKKAQQEEQLEEKPAKGKKSSKTVTNPETGRKNKVSYGQKGSTISPGTDKGDSYCARSFGIKKGLSKDKQNDPNTPNNLSRKKWKCKGEKSTK